MVVTILAVIGGIEVLLALGGALVFVCEWWHDRHAVNRLMTLVDEEKLIADLERQFAREP